MLGEAGIQPLTSAAALAVDQATCLAVVAHYRLVICICHRGFSKAHNPYLWGHVAGFGKLWEIWTEEGEQEDSSDAL